MSIIFQYSLSSRRLLLTQFTNTLYIKLLCCWLYVANPLEACQMWIEDKFLINIENPTGIHLAWLVILTMAACFLLTQFTNTL